MKTARLLVINTASFLSYVIEFEMEEKMNWIVVYHHYYQDSDNYTLGESIECIYRNLTADQLLDAIAVYKQNTRRKIVVHQIIQLH